MGFIQRLGFAAAVITMCLAAACGGPSEADMTKRWSAAETNAQKYASKYAHAKPAIDALLKEKKAEFDEAKKADEKTRGDKMKAVVDGMESKLKILDAYETEIAKLDALTKDKAVLDAFKGSELLEAKDRADKAKKEACCLLEAADQCSKKYTECKQENADFANFGELTAKLEPSIERLKTATKEWEAKKPSAPGGGTTTSPGGASTSSPGGSTASPGGTSTSKP